MSTSYNTTIVRNGLVFHLDIANTAKCWKGAPTTNLNPNATVVGFNNITYTNIGVTSDGYTIYSISGTWTSGTYPYSCYISPTTFTGGVSYSISCDIYTNVLGKYYSQSDFGVISQVNDPNMISSGTYVRSGTFSARNNFIYSVSYGGGSAANAGYLISRPIDNITFDPSTDFLYIKNIQVEQSTFATTYVNGVRSNTQSLIDLTKKNTVTANSLTYSSDGSFSLNGTSNNFTVSRATSLGSSLSIIMVIKTGATVTNQSFIFNANGQGLYPRIYTDGGGHLLCQYRINGVSQAVTDSGVLSANTVYHIGFTHESTSGLGVLYKNNASVASVTAVGAHDSGSNYTITFGYDSNLLIYGSGSIYLTKLYSRALSSTEVSTNFEAVRGRYGI